MTEFSMNGCTARLNGDRFEIANSRISRSWRITPGGLQAISLKSDDKEWLAPGDDFPGISAPQELVLTPSTTTLNAEFRKPSPVSAEALCAELAVDSDQGKMTLSAVIFPDTPAITLQLSFPASEQKNVQTLQHSSSTGVESDPVNGKKIVCTTDIQEYLNFAPMHMTLRNYQLLDQTDDNDNLFHLEEYRVSPKQQINLRGCLFAFEDVFDGHSVILLKHAPLPAPRPAPCAVDLQNRDRTAALTGHCAGETTQGYRWSVLAAENSSAGITATLQALQQKQRVYQPGLDGIALANTWGDRNRDACVNTTFMMHELELAAEMGIDACQIDDGWQKGTTANSAQAKEKGGVWEGFYASEPDFWQPHPERFPQGLDSLIARSKELGVDLGLWFAPDSSNEFANHELDAENISRMYHEWGVRFIKIDGVKARCKKGEARLLDLFHNSLQKCEGNLCFDQDITAEVRPGYWPLPETGTLFVENRYTDWGIWFPHATLRNLWQLAHVINPSRLRMEILNHERNIERYEGDPLAPATYSPEFIFATIMVSSPLFFCELSGLSEKTRQALAPIIKLWKEYRTELHTAACLPVGECPNGANFSGFLCTGEKATHLLVFRQLCSTSTTHIALPGDFSQHKATVISGNGTAEFSSGCVRVELPETNSFLWLRLER